MLNARLEIYVKKNFGEFILLNFAFDPHYEMAVGWGDFVRVDFDTMKTSGLDVVHANLADFSKRIIVGKDQFSLMSNREQNKFFKNHMLVAVSELRDQILLEPMIQVNKASHEGLFYSQLIIKLPSTNEIFFDALMKSFSVLQGKEDG